MNKNNLIQNNLENRMYRMINSLIFINILLSGCLGPFAPDPGPLHVRVYNGTPSDADVEIGLTKEKELQFNISMELRAYNQTREESFPSDEFKADLDAGHYKVWIMVNSRPCMPAGSDDAPEGWDGTVGGIGHFVGAIWAITIMPDLHCKIGKTSTA